MRVSPDHHSAGKGIVLKHNLVNDAGAGFPKTNPILVGDAGKEIINFLVSIQRGRQVLRCADLSLYQMITMDSGRHRYLIATTSHKLKQSHLRCSILHSYTVWSEINIIFSTLVRRFNGLRSMRVQDFFS